jgi:hypothetical protein
MLFADSLSAPTRAVVEHTHLHLGTATTIAMWLAVVALIAISGRLARMVTLYGGWLQWLGAKEADDTKAREIELESKINQLRSALSLARSMQLSGEQASPEAEAQIDKALRETRG